MSMRVCPSSDSLLHVGPEPWMEEELRQEQSPGSPAMSPTAPTFSDRPNSNGIWEGDRQKVPPAIRGYTGGAKIL